LLARLEALKFYSDIVESLLGAVWIDSGSFDVSYFLLQALPREFSVTLPLKM